MAVQKGGNANVGEKKEFTFTYEGSDKDLLSYSFTFVNEPTTVEVSKTETTPTTEKPTTPDNPTNPSTPTTSTETPKETPTTPKTGDDRNPLIWLLLLGLGGGLAGVAWYLRKKDEKDQNQE